MTPAQLADWVCEARQRTCELVADLTDSQMLGPRLAIINPLLWEIGHVAWFQEKWALRHAGNQRSIRPDADALYDSAAVPHDSRWDLPLPSRDETLRYLSQVRDRVVQRLHQAEPTPEDVYFTLLSVFHEDMHTEALTYTRQTLGYGAPKFEVSKHDAGGGPLPGDAEIPGGTFWLGAEPPHPPTPSPTKGRGGERPAGSPLSPLWERGVGGVRGEEPFVFDNEKWAHSVEVRPFAIARAAVTQAEFAAFVEDGGYRRQQFWSEEGWRWREQTDAQHPVYWQREAAGRWLRRDFDQWLPLEPHRPVLHVAWYEAEAYCRWAERRLPTETEWEVAAAAEPAVSRHGLAAHKRHFPWRAGSVSDRRASPAPSQANLDWRALGCVDVGALPEGDSAFGCRQMIGNVWEWTSSDFLPYPGFVADPYKEYSAPWFGTHKVLRGGCWATRSRLLRNTWRNFYRPDRRDVWAGFRTCALRP